MNFTTLKNGIKLIHEPRQGGITSFCIGFNVGALNEYPNFNIGTAHALEHMISKGTKYRSEEEINEIFDNIFGFENAMTNYPYTIYYGSCLTKNIETALKLYSEILLSPLFPRKDFKSEMDIILEELKEWKGDPNRNCEDTLFMNSFKKRRIKYPIIGSEESIKSITIEEVIRFYKCFYNPDNCVISFSSPLDFEVICSLVEMYFGNWENSSFYLNTESIEFDYEKNISGTYYEKKHNSKAAKIQYIFDISNVTFEEFKALMLFNCAFGEGTSSFLFHEIRTKNAAAYEIGSHIKNENGIKLLSINMGTSIEKVRKSIDIIDNVINEIKNSREYFTKEVICNLANRIKIKRELKIERSIQLCKELTTYQLMYGDFKRFYREVQGLEKISGKDICYVISKVLNNPSIQVVES
ncbi:insulinase family protein [Clostridium sp. cel8]|jgi:predicted Zn-dependent peptidase|uniref:M16 family metallopeptidase n=1 Tax=unclassified Clostridium TaxID=2614128 RepID=UPI0015F6E76F|nr:pitrilysin family protein [Clostridium sp. cel8]MBA5851107.1 insulinase family protein [Clostridium sp. cel8]